MRAAGLAFETGEDLWQTGPERYEWVWQGYLARGYLTALCSLPKVGKSTLVAELLRALCHDQQTFCGTPIEPSPVVLVTEEARGHVRQRLTSWGDDARGRLLLAARDTAPGGRPPWDVVIADATSKAHAEGAGLLVLDTLRGLAGLEDGKENDSSFGRVLDPALEAAASGLAVLVLHHNRKSEGSHGMGASGNNAFLGALDALLDLTRDGPGTRRRLEVVGRFETPPLVLERREDGYHSLGTAADNKAAERAERMERIKTDLLAPLALAPTEGLTPAKLREAIMDESGRPSINSVRVALRELYAASRVEQLGNGAKGSPYTYRGGAGFSFGNASTTPYVEAERIESGPTFAQRELEL